MFRKTILFGSLLILAACSNSPTISVSVTETIIPLATGTLTLTATAIPTGTTTPQPHLSPITYGPEAEDFPPDINPLTGRAVADPELLKFPAVLVSISNMPVTARPQAGPGFAPWVYELFIGEGTTRFLNVFYGDFPRAVPNVSGGCEVRDEIIRPQGEWIGNRIWLDETTNGQQDAWEAGVGGVCVRLLDSTNRAVLAETTTDSNGYYAFESPGVDAMIQFVKAASYEFTKQDVGDENRDSDADANGETKVLGANSTASFWDAGLILLDEPVPTPSPVVTGTPPNWFLLSEPYVGPIRSGRLTYNQIGGMFPNSCLVYASAAWDIGERLDACEIVYGVDKFTPNSALLPVTRLRELAEQSLNPRQPVNYSGNLFSEELPASPAGAKLADKIDIFYHTYTQSGWQYDPVSQTYLRWTDLADGTGTLIPATDRLTQRQMAFENVVIIFAEHDRFRHNQLEINFHLGQKNIAYLFRDGQVFEVFWSTENRGWETETGLLRPMHFIDAQGNLVPLRPGRTWIHIITPFSLVTDQGNGDWLMRFVQPYDPEDTPIPEEPTLPPEPTLTPEVTPTPEPTLTLTPESTPTSTPIVVP